MLVKKWLKFTSSKVQRLKFLARRFNKIRECFLSSAMIFIHLNIGLTLHKVATRDLIVQSSFKLRRLRNSKNTWGRNCYKLIWLMSLSIWQLLVWETISVRSGFLSEKYLKKAQLWVLSKSLTKTVPTVELCRLRLCCMIKVITMQITLMINSESLRFLVFS